MRQWLKNATKRVFGTTEPADGVELSEDEALLIERKAQEALNTHYKTLFSAKNLEIPQDVPLIESCHIISSDDEDSDFPETYIDIHEGNNGEKIYEIVNLLIIYNYPMALMETSNVALFNEFATFVTSPMETYEDLIKEKNKTVQFPIGQNTFVAIPLNLQIERQNMPEGYQLSITAIQTVISNERPDLEKLDIDIGFDKDCSGNTYLYIESESPLSDEQKFYLEDVSRLNLPENVRGMKINIRQISEQQQKLMKMVCNIK